MAPTTTGKTPLIDSVFNLLSRPQAAHLAVLPSPVAHPLDPLTAGEITAAGKAVREHAQSLSIKAIRFNAITLQVISQPVCCIGCIGSIGGSPHEGIACRSDLTSGRAIGCLLSRLPCWRPQCV